MNRNLSRRHFLGTSAFALAGVGLSLHAADTQPEPIIDIHQHTDYGGKRNANWDTISPGRNHEQLIAHQRAMGVTKTILLPSGHPVRRESTHMGRSNGLESTCTSNEVCYKLAKQYPDQFTFGACEVPDVDGAATEIEKYLKLGAVIIGELKFGVECDSAEMQKIYQLAQAYNVPVLMHWQVKMYNYGFERFYKMLEKYPKVNFIGHAQTWWANIDKDNRNDPTNLYPRTKVTPGGTTDRYLSDYPNMFGDMSAGSGHGALTRDEDHAREFIKRHQDKLLFGSDCDDTLGRGAGCTGATTIAEIRKLIPETSIQRKLLYENSKKLFRF